MTTASKLMAAAAVMMSMAAPQAEAGELLAGGYRHAPPYRHGYAPWNYRMGYMARRSYAPQRPDLGAAIGGALAGAAMQLIPRATEALLAKLPPEASTPSPPPIATAQPESSPPSGDVLDDIQGNQRGITREEVEAALVDWCASHGDAPLCVKLQAAPPPAGPGPSSAPPPGAYYRAYSEPGPRRYYRPGRFPSWNGCQQGWTVQDGLCKPYRGY